MRQAENSPFIRLRAEPTPGSVFAKQDWENAGDFARMCPEGCRFGAENDDFWKHVRL
jgi:hypothetical protein